jgi:diguanylate cyclase (GGDEF)-like protein/PAS domain S-box-containing protein
MTSHPERNLSPSPATPPGNEIERLKFVLRSSRLALWDWDMESDQVLVDSAWAAMIGRTPEELGTLAFEDFGQLCHPGDLRELEAAIAQHIKGHDAYYDHEFRMRHADGRWRWIRARGQVVARGEDDTPTRMTGTHEDVTERHRRDRELQRSKQQLDAAQRLASVGSWHLDTVTGEVTWTDELYRMLGFDPTLPPPPGDRHGELFTDESWSRLSAAIERTRTDGTPYELELEMEHGGRHVGWMLARGEAVLDDGDAIVGIQGVAIDITSRKHNEATLERLASRDPLTGLVNRASLIEEIERTMKDVHAGTTLAACLLVDLDNFKIINDSLGHEFGDLILQSAARRLNRIARASDITARLGGDEFVILLRNLSGPDAADEVAQRVVRAFRSPFNVEGHELYLTASVGVAVAEVGGEMGDLLRDADTAMYAAKEAGRDQAAAFNQRLRTGVTDRVRLERDLRTAIDAGELEAWFQPEVDLRTGRITGGEALLRWRRSDGRVTSAKDFIRISEETGLIRRIGNKMLVDACRAAVDWQSHDPIAVRVNTSIVQLSEPGFLSNLDRALSITGLRPELLCLEFTETVLLRETATVRANVHGVSERGISIAIDDFGTGYASLSYLHRYAVDVIKIDKSFVDVSGRSAHSARLIEGIIGMGRIMDIDVIAEGVETTQQAQTLLGLGCVRAQGYLFSPAVPAADFLDLIRDGFPPVGVMASPVP